MVLKITYRARLPILILIMLLSFTACGQLPTADPGVGVDLNDPDVGGGVGIESGPETPVPTATITREGSPRLDAAARATADARPPTPEPTAVPAFQPPTAEPAADPPPEGEPSPEPPAPTEAAPPEPSPTPTGEIIHVVQPGENLYQIGLLYGLSWQTIAEYNGITNPDAIDVGQELKIPES